MATLNLTYTITGVQKAPPVTLIDGTQQPDKYQVSIVVHPDPRYPDVLDNVPPFNIFIPKEALALYVVDKGGSITFNDPA